MNMVGKAAGDIQQGAFAGGFVERHCGFEQMAGTVKLMALRQIGPAQAGLFQHVPGVEIAVLALGGG
ncbi:hypothetical protein D3C75_1035550 [compost metagenome]